MARSCPSNGREALVAEDDVRHSQIRLEEISWRSATDMAIKYEEELAVAGACRLPGWGPRDSPH